MIACGLCGMVSENRELFRKGGSNGLVCRSECRCKQRRGWVDCPCDGKKCKLSVDDERHGTFNGYGNCRCRCESCCVANTVYLGAAKDKRAGLEPGDPRHGTVNGYGNYGCRCRPCTEAWNEAENDRRYRRKRGLTKKTRRPVLRRVRAE